MACWLLKTEPSDYSFADLERDGTTTWDGVRNNAALKHLRAMQPGDLVFVYHTGSERQIVGVAAVQRAAYPDPQAATTDERSAPPVVDVRAVRRLPQPVTLADIKADPFFADFALVRQGRLSVVPVSDEQWARLCDMAGEAH
jgi:predicted RNA-binding protein with PUA-like domain